MLYCQSSLAQPYVVDPHTPIVCLMWERVGGQCYINKNVFHISRVVVRETASPA